MSNIDKHAVQAVADLKAGYTLGHADVAILNELARIALASLEAEPVAWRHFQETPTDGGYWVLNDYKPNCSGVEPLYTAPPAPISVPAAMEMDDDFDSSFEHGKAVGWNAYRAAMLQGADGNSPVIPDSWVACSERMPKIGIKVLCFPVNDEPIHATYNGQVWLQDISWSTSDEPIDNVISCNVFHWMPLPAAPQQEVNP
ncbi:DUF551 domain-containing protein [Escherichia coli]|uniref:DUF551 domain-containing protein n=1 Tax=Escherichia coli TaxID=562 RepID=UPI00233FA557|nr:DUF551 domain-containing protein [Escherichia coli]MDC3532864.1 DUF551 domain-containing protein [Escherichia coli]